MTLTDSNGNRIHLNNVCYCPASQYRILSFMNFRLEFCLDFQFTDWETFMFTASNGFEVHGRSVNQIMHISPGSQPEIKAGTTDRAAAETLCNSFKRKPAEIEEAPSDPENDADNDDVNVPGRSDPELRNEPASSPTGSVPTQPIPPIGSSSRNLWPLRFGHASTTALHKLHLIKSSFDSHTCHPCLRAKKTRRPFPSSESQEEVDLFTRMLADPSPNPSKTSRFATSIKRHFSASCNLYIPPFIDYLGKFFCCHLNFWFTMLPWQRGSPLMQDP